MVIWKPYHRRADHNAIRAPKDGDPVIDVNEPPIIRSVSNELAVSGHPFEKPP